MARSGSRGHSTGALSPLPWQRWLPGLLVLVGVGIYVALVSLQQDLAAFFVAGRAVAAGRNPYLNEVAALWDGVSPFRHSRFLYPPLFAFAMRAFAALPYLGAKLAFTACSLLCWVVALRGLAQALALRSAAQRWLVALAAWLPPVWLTLERGQTDLMALAFLVLAFTRRASSWRAGALVALAMLVKPVLLPSWLALLLGRHWKVALVAAAWLAGGLVLGATVTSAAITKTYLGEVLPRVALLGEGGREADLLRDEERTAREERWDAEGRVVLDGRAWAANPIDISRSASLTRLLAPEGPTPLGTLAPPFLFLAWLLYVFRRRQAGPWVWAALPIATVICAPTGWAMSLTLALPFVALAVARLQDASAPLERRVTRLMAASLLGILVGPWMPGAWVLAGGLLVAAGSVAPVQLPEAPSPLAAAHAEA